MNKIDLIIDALEKAMPLESDDDFMASRKAGWDRHNKALAAARELKELKPVGEFKRDHHGAWYEIPSGSGGRKFYRRNGVTK